MRKNVIYVFIAITIIGAGSYAVMKVKAADSNTNYPPIIQKLVDKFKLNPDEVKQVFDENRAEKQQERMQKFEDKLNQAVTDGKINEAEKSAISAKSEEFRTKMESYKDLSPEERKTKMQELRDEIKSWAKDNGIDYKFMQFMRKFHGGMGPGGMGQGIGKGETNLGVEEN